MEAQQKIDANLEDVRQMEVHVNKAEARLDALRVAGMDVSKWLQKAGEKNGGENSLSIGGSISKFFFVCVWHKYMTNCPTLERLYKAGTTTIVIPNLE